MAAIETISQVFRRRFFLHLNHSFRCHGIHVCHVLYPPITAILKFKIGDMHSVIYYFLLIHVYQCHTVCITGCKVICHGY